MPITTSPIELTESLGILEPSLHTAIRTGDEEKIRSFIQDSDVNLQEKDNQGNTVLHLIAASPYNFSEELLAEFLVPQDPLAGPTIPFTVSNKEGKNPFEVALATGNLRRFEQFLAVSQLTDEEKVALIRTTLAYRNTALENKADLSAKQLTEIIDRLVWDLSTEYKFKDNFILQFPNYRDLLLKDEKLQLFNQLVGSAQKVAALKKDREESMGLQLLFEQPEENSITLQHPRFIMELLCDIPIDETRGISFQDKHDILLPLFNQAVENYRAACRNDPARKSSYRVLNRLAEYFSDPTNPLFRARERNQHLHALIQFTLLLETLLVEKDAEKQLIAIENCAEQLKESPLIQWLARPLLFIAYAAISPLIETVRSIGTGLAAGYSEALDFAKGSAVSPHSSLVKAILFLLAIPLTCLKNLLDAIRDIPDNTIISIVNFAERDLAGIREKNVKHSLWSLRRPILNAWFKEQNAKPLSEKEPLLGTTATAGYRRLGR